MKKDLFAVVVNKKTKKNVYSYLRKLFLDVMQLKGHVKLSLNITLLGNFEQYGFSWVWPSKVWFTAVALTESED